MKVRALTTFGGANDKGRYHVSAGDEFELPEHGADWIRAGLVEPVETAMMAPAEGRKAEPQPVTEVKGIGPATAEELAELGIKTVADLAAADVPEEYARFQEAARGML